MPETEDTYQQLLRAALRRALATAESLLSADDAEVFARRVAGRTSEQQAIYLASCNKAARFEVGRALVGVSFRYRHDDPAKMLALARLAVRLLNRSAPPPELRSLHTDALAEAWGNLANAYRITVSRHWAINSLRRARAYFESGTGDPILGARLRSFLGSVWLDDRNYPKAEECFKKAAKQYASVGENHLAGRELAALAAAYSAQGRLDDARAALVSAMLRIDLSRDAELGISCVMSLLRALLDAGRPIEALDLLQDWELVFEIGAGEVTIWRLRWFKARVLAQLNHATEAVRELELVLRALVKFRLPYDAVLAGLDLAALYAKAERFGVVRRLAEQLLPLLTADAAAPEARAAFAVWFEAARAERTSEQEIRCLAGELERIRAQARSLRRRNR